MALPRVAVGAAGLTAACWWSLHKYALEETGPALIAKYLDRLVKPALKPELGDEALKNVRYPVCNLLVCDTECLTHSLISFLTVVVSELPPGQFTC